MVYRCTRPACLGRTQSLLALILVVVAIGFQAHSRTASACSSPGCDPQESVDLWSDLAPGETSRSRGVPLERRPNEDPPATRIRGITCPTLDVFPAAPGTATGAAIVVMPGGAYNYVVVDKEGSEIAAALNPHGVAVFVLRYRTRPEMPGDEALWKRPLQDAQRAIRLVRSNAQEWQIDPDKVGVLGSSAGGQAAALTLTHADKATYPTGDAIDDLSCRPNFGLLIYPWQLIPPMTNELMSELKVTRETPPTFLVHTHDDRSTALSSILFYTALKKAQVGAELHIYESGGHGYGVRPVEGSQVHTWPERAVEWLARRDLARP